MGKATTKPARRSCTRRIELRAKSCRAVDGLRSKVKGKRAVELRAET